MRQAWLRVTPSSNPADVPAFAARVGTPAWVILESYPKLLFKNWAPGEPLPVLGEEFAGRIFGGGAEVRWTREGDRFALWVLEEVDGPAAGGNVRRFDAEDRAYYALGYWENGRFWEATLPGDRVEYPAIAADKDDRPRFKVVEYYRVAPATWPGELGAIEDELNRPSLAAYRLAGFDAGKDGL